MMITGRTKRLGKRCLSMLLIAAMVLGLIPQSAYAAGTGEETEQHPKTWMENDSLMKNDYIGLYTNQNGRYSIGTTGGDPENEKDENKKILYGYDSGSTSYTTFRINGSNYQYSSRTSAFDTDRADNTSEMDQQGIHITQKLSMLHNSATGRDDVVEIRYTVQNESDEEKNIGCRIMMDTQLGGNDSAPFRIPGVGAVTTETEYEGEDIPQIWQAFDSLSDPSVIAQGRFYKSTADRPDKVQFGNWRGMSGTAWDYPTHNGSGNGDSAVAVTWKENTLAPGETREYVTYYGLSEFSQDISAPLILSVYSEAELEEQDGSYVPNPFPVSAYIENIGSDTAKEVSVKLELPKGLTLAGDSEETVILGDVPVSRMRQAGWQVQAAPVRKDTDYKIRVVLSYDNGASKSVTRKIHVPAATGTASGREVPKALDYTLFTLNSLAMSGYTYGITGNVYTGKSFMYSGSGLNISGRLDAADTIQTSGWQINIGEQKEHAEETAMPDLFGDIERKAGDIERFEDSTTFTDEKMTLSHSIKSQKDITFAGAEFEGSGYVIAGGDITCQIGQAKNYNDGKVVFCSEQGNITLNGSEFYLNGILYAPNGTVFINAHTFHLKGRIIAKNIMMSCGKVEIEGEEGDVSYLFDKDKTEETEDRDTEESNKEEEQNTTEEPDTTQEQPEKGRYERTFTTDDDFSEGVLNEVSQRVDDALVLEYTDSEQTVEEPDVRTYESLQDGTGFILSDTLDKTVFFAGNEETTLTYQLTSFADGSCEADPESDTYNYVAKAVGRKILLETTLLHAEQIITEQIQPGPDQMIRNEDGSLTIRWQYDRLTSGDNFTYHIPLRYRDLTENGIFGISRNTMLLYYDEKGDPQIIYPEDRNVTVTDVADSGYWEVVCDAEKTDTDWDHIVWSGSRPDDADIKMYVSASDDNEHYTEVTEAGNGVRFNELHGRYLKVRAVLQASSSGKTPELDEVTVSTEPAELTANRIPELIVKEDYEAETGQPVSVVFAGKDDANGGLLRYGLNIPEGIHAETEQRSSLTSVVTFREAGTYVLQAEVSDGEYSDGREIVFVVRDAIHENIGEEPEQEEPDMVLPTAEIREIREAVVTDGSLSIIGTAGDDRELAGYLLTYRSAAGDTEHLICSSEEPVTDDVLGVLDLSGLTEGDYVITLTVSDTSGNQSVATAGMHVECPDQIPPEVDIISVTLNEEKDHMIITGTAKDDTVLASYRLTMTYPSGEEKVLAEGHEAVEREVLAEAELRELESGSGQLKSDALDAIAGTPTDFSDRPYEQQKIRSVTVETFGESYPEPEKEKSDPDFDRNSFDQGFNPFKNDYKYGDTNYNPNGTRPEYEQTRSKIKDILGGVPKVMTDEKVEEMIHNPARSTTQEAPTTPERWGRAPNGWFCDYDDVMAKAQQTGKAVAIFFHNSSNDNSRKFRTERMENSKFKNKMHDRLLVLYMDYPENAGTSKDRRNRDQVEHNRRIADQFHVSNYPTVIFLDSTGKELSRVSDMKTVTEFVENADRVVPQREAKAKDIGRITPAMIAACAGPETKGIYIEASLSAKIADGFEEIKALVPQALLLWEINGDDLRDPAGKEAIEARIAQVDAFSLNFDEACGFFGTSDPDAILTGLRAYGKPCFFRLGEAGAGLVTADGAVFASAIGLSDSVDPTGCGNCSTAASLIGLAEGYPAERTVLMANLAASYCARQTPPCPKADDAFRAQMEQKLEELLGSTAFTYDALPELR